MSNVSARPKPAPRHVVKDAASAVAFLVLAFVAVKTFGRVFGFIGGLFFLAITLGSAYYFARSAWNCVLEGRGHSSSNGEK